LESIIPKEIAIVKFHLNPAKSSRYIREQLEHGYIEDNWVEFWMNEKSTEKWQKHLKEERIADTECGDQIKYNSQNEIEWVFSPRYCWYELPEEAKKEITANDLS
jgi:hypothetical protein